MRKIIISLFSMAMIVCFFICGISIVFDPRNVGFNQEEVTLLTDGWFYQKEDGQREAFIPPSKVPSVGDKPFEIYKTLDQSIPQGVTLGFRSSQQEVWVSVDDEIIYSYGKAEMVPTMPTSPASAWHIVSLPSMNPGQVIKISSLSPYSSYQGKINEMMVGSKSAILFHIATRYFPAVCSSTLVLVLGLILVIYGLYIYKIRHSANFIYLGFFGLLLGSWFFGESKFTQFFYGNVLLSYQMVFLSVALIPIPALLFFSSALQPDEQRVYEYVCIGAIINFFAMVLAQTVGLIDFYEWLPISHVFIILSMLLVIHSMMEFNRKYSYRRAKFLFIGVIVFILAGLIDIFVFYTSNKSDSTLFLQLGTLISITIIAKGEFNKNLELIKLGFEAAALKKVAFTDALTQIGNRYAFDNVLEEIGQKEPAGNIDNAVIVIDVDGLKFANDTYGHWMGDQLICYMAECLRTVFCEEGKYFRIGGDEFAVILRGKREELLNYSSRLRDVIDLNNKESQYNLSASWGIAFQSETNQNSIQEAFQMADALMYKDKEKKKQGRSYGKGLGINIANRFRDS